MPGTQRPKCWVPLVLMLLMPFIYSTLLPASYAFSDSGSCQIQGAECGSVLSPLGEQLNCGTCPASQQCVANRCENRCTPSQTGEGDFDDLFAWIPTQISSEDWSESDFPVTPNLLQKPETFPDFPFTSETDFSYKSLLLQTGNTSTTVPYSITFKFIPDDQGPDHQSVFNSEALSIELVQNQIQVTTRGASGQAGLMADQAQIFTKSCNQLMVDITETSMAVYLNGSVKQIPLEAGQFQAMKGSLQIGPWQGKTWDIRIFNKVLSPEQKNTIGSDCHAQKIKTSPWEGYDEYLCSVYICIWWPQGVTDTSHESFQYQTNAHDMTWEHNVLKTGMYKHGNICEELQKPRDIQMTEGYRKSWVSRFNEQNPWGNYVLHENFHAFQKRAGGGSKFLLESSANWGGYSMRPGTDNNSLLGMYTLQPHLPLYTTQSSPIAEGIIDAYKGGHQYGAGIFHYYLSEFVVNQKIIGFVFNDPRRFSSPAAAMYDYLQAAGYDMRDIFSEFAARTTTWDYGFRSPGWIAAEESSYRRMVRSNPSDNPWPEEEIDNKISVAYDQSGTGNQWTPVPSRYKPGPWSWNAYQITVTEAASFTAKFKASEGNPAGVEFRSILVRFRPDTGERTYTNLIPGDETQVLEARAMAQPGDSLYLIVAATPSTVFSGWDAYQYDYILTPDVPDSGMSSGDIGQVGFPGSKTETHDQIILTGSGTDIYGTADSFYFAWKKLSGDGSVSAKVFSVENTNPWAKAGVMIRNSLDPSDKAAALVISAHDRSAFQWRPQASQRTRYSLEGPGAPTWLKIERSGDQISGYRSDDGVTWNLANSVTLPMNQTVYIGLATTSHNNEAITRAVFSRPDFTGDTQDGDTNQKPVANSQFLQADQDQPVPVLLEGSDPDGDALSYQITSLPAHGSLSGVAPDLTYTPEPGFSGADSFSFMVSDGKEDSEPAQVQIKINRFDQKPKIFLLAGQSNMVGYGSNSELPFIEPGLATQRPDVFIQNIIEGARALSPLSPGFGRNSRMYGVELKFGHEMGDLYENQEVWFFKASKGGTTIDNPDHWRPLSHGGNPGNLYQQMMDGFRNFLKTNFENQGKEYEIAGFIWFQGYNDTFGSEIRYETNLRNFLNTVKSDLNNPDLPTVIVQINDVRGAPGRIVMDAQKTLSEEHPCHSLAITGDQRPYYHYGSYSYVTIGDRIAKAAGPCLGFPTANHDLYQVRSGDSLTISKTQGALSNDKPSVLHTDTVLAQLKTPPANGTLTFNPDGSFQYSSNPGFIGIDAFTYQISGGRTGNIARVRIHVRNDQSPVVLHFPFDGNQQEALMDKASGFNSRIVKSGVTFGHPGVQGESAYFDGQGLLHFLEEYPVPSLLDLQTSSDFTWTMSLKTDGPLDGERIIVSNKYWWNRNGGGYAIATDGAGKGLRVFLSAYDHETFSSKSVSFSSTQGVIDDGQWHSVAVVASFSTGELIIYLDGSEAGRTNIGALKGEINRFESAIGDGSYGGDGNSKAFQGYLDELKLHKAALNPAQISSLTKHH